MSRSVVKGAAASSLLRYTGLQSGVAGLSKPTTPRLAWSQNDADKGWRYIHVICAHCWPAEDARSSSAMSVCHQRLLIRTISSLLLPVARLPDRLRVVLDGKGNIATLRTHDDLGHKDRTFLNEQER